MDGKVISFDPGLNRGELLGQDKQRYGFAGVEWQSVGEPEPGQWVHFVANDDGATQVNLRFPEHPAPLTPGEAIAAVYTTAFSRVSHDFFGAAPIRKRDFVLPVLAILVFGLLQSFVRGLVPEQLYRLPVWAVLLVFAFVMIAFLVIVAIATGIVALLGRAFGQRGRVRAGVFAFIWVEAAVMQPAVFLLRLILGPRDPGPVLLLLAAMLITAVIAAGRVVKMGFQLSNAGVGIFIVIVASLAGFILDRLVG
jgi:hypothetical protein